MADEFAGTKVAPDGKRYDIGAPELSEPEDADLPVRVRGEKVEGAVPTVDDDGRIVWQLPAGGGGDGEVITSLTFTFETAARYNLSTGGSGIAQLDDTGVVLGMMGADSSASVRAKARTNTGSALLTPGTSKVSLQTLLDLAFLDDGNGDIIASVGIGGSRLNSEENNVLAAFAGSDGEGTTLSFQSSSSNVSTVDDAVAVIADPSVMLRIELDLGEEARCYVNDELMSTITTNVPDTLENFFSIDLETVTESSPMLMTVPYVTITRSA